MYYYWSMKKLVVGNWKMNPASLKEAQELFDAIKDGIKGAKAEVVICPPFIYLSQLKGLPLGAQDVFYEERGTFTGEISPTQLKDLGVEYVLVGHSERRKLGETSELVAKKMQAALTAGLKVILCVGENEGENKEEVLRQQLAGVSGVIVAYEPVWAISTGDPYKTKALPTPQIVKESADLIKKILGDENVRVIYGGSTNAANAKEYLEVVDGLLPGGASLKADEFVKIVESASV